jgi:hypothetical protein
MIDEALTRICFNICSSLIDYIHDDCNECEMIGEGCRVHGEKGVVTKGVVTMSVTSDQNVSSNQKTPGNQITTDLEYIPKLYTDTINHLTTIYATPELSNEIKRQCMWLDAAQFISAALMYKLTAIYKNTLPRVEGGGAINKGSNENTFGNFLSFIGISHQSLFVQDANHDVDDEVNPTSVNPTMPNIGLITKNLNEFIECIMTPTSSLYETPSMVVDLNLYLDTLVKGGGATTVSTVSTVLVDCIRGIVNRHVDTRKKIYYTNIANKKGAVKGITLSDVN